MMITDVIQDHNPIQQFQKWFFEAEECYEEQEPNAMYLTTIGRDDFPKSRMVLLKKYTWEGFIFYTNYNSEKGKAIQINSRVNLLFNWVKSQRMVSVTGTAIKISNQESINYFDIRPRGSKLGAWASNQSEVVDSRKSLEDNLTLFTNYFEGKEIPKPQNWGGYILKPQELVFMEDNNEMRFCQSYHLKENYFWSKKENIYIIEN